MKRTFEKLSGLGGYQSNWERENPDIVTIPAEDLLSDRKGVAWAAKASKSGHMVGLTVEDKPVAYVIPKVMLHTQALLIEETEEPFFEIYNNRIWQKDLNLQDVQDISRSQNPVGRMVFGDKFKTEFAIVNTAFARDYLVSNAQSACLFSQDCEAALRGGLENWEERMDAIFERLTQAQTRILEQKGDDVDAVMGYLAQDAFIASTMRTMNNFDHEVKITPKGDLPKFVRLDQPQQGEFAPEHTPS